MSQSTFQRVVRAQSPRVSIRKREGMVAKHTHGAGRAPRQGGKAVCQPSSPLNLVRAEATAPASSNNFSRVQMCSDPAAISRAGARNARRHSRAARPLERGKRAALPPRTDGACAHLQALAHARRLERLRRRIPARLRRSSRARVRRGGRGGSAAAAARRRRRTLHTAPPPAPSR